MTVPNKYLLFLYSIVCFSASFRAQNTEDSLKKIILAHPKDTSGVNALNQLSVLYRYEQSYEQALSYAEKALQLSVDLKDQKAQRLALSNIGEVYFEQGNYTNSLEKFEKALDLARQMGIKKTIAYELNNVGILHRSLSNYPRALENYFAALKLYDELADSMGIAGGYNNIGIIYDLQGDLDNALKNQLLALEIIKRLKNQKRVADMYFNISSTYARLENPEMALQYLSDALKYYRSINYTRGEAAVISNIGLIYFQMGDYDKAERFLLDGVKIKKEYDYSGITASYINLAAVYIKTGKTKEARKNLNAALLLAQKSRSKEDLKNIYVDLATIDSISGNYRDAFRHYKLGAQYRDSLFNEENTKKTVQSQMQYEFDKKEAIAKAEQIKKDAISAESARRKNTIIVSVIAGLFLVLLFSLFLFNRFRVIRKQKHIIESQKKIVEQQKHIVEDKQKEILDSIHYARRIQKALVTNEKYIQKNLDRLSGKKHL
jgi:tetratricopeptide (TPR) repeat protein